MALTDLAEPRVPGGAPVPLRTRLGALLALTKVAKFTVYQHYFGIALAATLVPWSVAGQWRTGAVLGLCLLSIAGVVATTTALDDLAGYRNGGDARTYGAKGRGSRRKPLLEGTVTERQVAVFASITEAVALLAGVAAFLVAHRFPPLAVLLFLVPAVVSTQYSWGLRLSFHPGGGELLLFGSTVATLLWPYLLIGGTAMSPALVQAALLAVWFLVVLMSENAHDAEADRAVGRRTLAAAYPLRLTRVLVAILVAGSVLLELAAVAAGWLGWLALPLLVPAWVLQVLQLRDGLSRGRWLRAAVYGFMAFNLGFLALLGTGALAW
jgi:1,4-dihydroxy-2-naphthoate octaprenyltransferase